MCECCCCDPNAEKNHSGCVLPFAKYEHTKSLRKFLRRLAWTSLLPMLLVGVPRVVLDVVFPGVGVMFFHFSGWLRLPQFYQVSAVGLSQALRSTPCRCSPARPRALCQGIVLGQGCLHVELTQREGKGLGIIVDAISLFLLAFILSPVPAFPVVLEIIHVPLLSFVLFGVCRAPGTSYTARILSSGLLRALTPYTYGIYMIHIPIIRTLRPEQRSNHRRRMRARLRC